MRMPTLRHFLEDLQNIGVDPEEIRIPGQLYDDLVDEAEDLAQKNPHGAEKNQQTRSSLSVRDKEHLVSPQ
jgi:hypothetical protein